MKIDEKLNKTKLMLWARVGKRALSILQNVIVFLQRF